MFKSRKRENILREIIRQRHADMSELLARCLATDEGRYTLEFWAARECIELGRSWGGEIISMGRVRQIWGVPSSIV